MQNIYQALFIKSLFPVQLCIFLYLKSEEPRVILVGRKQTGLVKVDRPKKEEKRTLYLLYLKCEGKTVAMCDSSSQRSAHGHSYLVRMCQVSGI